MFVCLFVCLFVCSFVCSFVRLFVCLFVCLFHPHNRFISIFWNRECWIYWNRHIQQGLGSAGNPSPWSCAVNLAGRQRSRGRSAICLCCFAFFSCALSTLGKYWSPLLTADLFLLNFVALALWSIMEHPAIPSDPTFASIWRTTIHADLFKRAPLANLVYIEQWRYGAMSVKPTMLRGLGLPKLASHLHECKDTNLTRPTAVLSGYDSAKGCFRTAAAKEYPPKLCEALVRSAFRSLRLRIAKQQMSFVQWNSLDPDARSWAQALADCSCSSFASSYLPDYQPV